MDWLTSMRQAIEYMEVHLLEDIDAKDVANAVHMSSFYLQKGFKVMTGYTIREYIRCRRLYMAALEVAAGREKIIDLADKYGYDTPQSFTKAFSRFHGVTPTQIKKDTGKIVPFLPLKIQVSMQGGREMDFVVEKERSFWVIGFEREFLFENSYQEIPKFWEEISAKYLIPLWKKDKPENEMERVIESCKIGEYGVCIDDLGRADTFRYLIAGIWRGDEVPKGLSVYEFPALEWAKFRCFGQLSGGALQAVNTKIFREWLPENPDYEMAIPANIEWYSAGDVRAADYESAVWLPVRKKEGV